MARIDDDDLCDPNCGYSGDDRRSQESNFQYILHVFVFVLFCFSCYQILKVLIAKRTFSLQQKIMNLEQRNRVLEDTARNLKTTLTHLVSEVGMLQVK